MYLLTVPINQIYIFSVNTIKDSGILKNPVIP